MHGRVSQFHNCQRSLDTKQATHGSMRRVRSMHSMHSPTCHQRQPLNAVKVSVLNGHHPSVREQLLREVVDELRGGGAMDTGVPHGRASGTPQGRARTGCGLCAAIACSVEPTIGQSMRVGSEPKGSGPALPPTRHRPPAVPATHLAVDKAVDAVRHNLLALLPHLLLLCRLNVGHLRAGRGSHRRVWARSGAAGACTGRGRRPYSRIHSACLPPTNNSAP